MPENSSIVSGAAARRAIRRIHAMSHQFVCQDKTASRERGEEYHEIRFGSDGEREIRKRRGASTSPGGKVPGVLYGQGECLLLTIEPEPLIKILKSQAGSTALITLTINGAKAKAKRTALPRDFQVIQ